MSEHIVFLVIFDTCDVLYNWPISVLPPIVLDLFILFIHITTNKYSAWYFRIYYFYHQIQTGP